MDSIHNLLIILDLDETLVTKNTSYKLTEPGIPAFLKHLTSKNALLFISSRNPPHFVHHLLEHFKISQYFLEILADYRSKEFHVKHALQKLKRREITPPAIIFIDDHVENCRRVASLRGYFNIPIYVLVYGGQPPRDLATITNLLFKIDFKALKEISL